MIIREQIEELLESALKSRSLFLIDVEIRQKEELIVTIDSYNDVNIEDCTELSRIINTFLESKNEDYALTVTSAGLDQPLKTEEQYRKYIGKEVSVVLNNSKKINAKLVEYSKDGCLFSYYEMIKEEGKKRKTLTEISSFIKFSELRYIKPFIKIR